MALRRYSYAAPRIIGDERINLETHNREILCEDGWKVVATEAQMIEGLKEFLEDNPLLSTSPSGAVPRVTENEDT